MPTPTYTPLANITLGSAAASVTFSSISQAYKDLVIVFSGSNNSVGSESILMRFNSDAGSNYSDVRMVGTGTSATSATYTGTGNTPAVSSSSTRFNFTTQIMDYSATDKHKTSLSRTNQIDGWVAGFTSRWANTAAITSITLIGSSGSGYVWSTGSTFALYGIAA